MIQGLTKTVVSGLTGQPVLLAMLALNLVMVVAAVWFLSTLATNASKNMELVLRLCMGKAGLAP